MIKKSLRAYSSLFTYNRGSWVRREAGAVEKAAPLASSLGLSKSLKLSDVRFPSSLKMGKWHLLCRVVSMIAWNTWSACYRIGSHWKRIFIIDCSTHLLSMYSVLSWVKKKRMGCNLNTVASDERLQHCVKYDNWALLSASLIREVRVPSYPCTDNRN